MLLTTPVGELPRFLGGGGGLGNIGNSDNYTWLMGVHGLGGGTCRVDAKTVKGQDGSVWPDSDSSYPSCNYSENYMALQNALVALSASLNDSRINPGKTDGMLENGLPSNQVMGAIVMALPHLKSKLGTATTTILTIALAFGASSTRAKQAVKDYMGPLAIAIQGVVAMRGGGSAPDAGSSLIPAGGAWYKTWWGAGGIAIGVIGVLYLLTQRRA